MKKMMIALMAVLITVALAGIGTYAYFSDTATIKDTVFTAGTLNLKLDSNPDPNVYNWVDGFGTPSEYYVTNLYPGYPTKGEHNWQVIDILNVGEIDGDASIRLDVTSWSALADNLVFTIYYDTANTGAWVGKQTGTLAELNGKTYLLGPVDSGLGNYSGLIGKMASIKLMWNVPNEAGNDIQGQSVVFDALFSLQQH